MKINLVKKNLGFVKILNNEFKHILIDANIFIPPDRSRENKNIKPVSFEYYKKNWLKPFIQTFKPVGIHEPVYEEFTSNSIRAFVDEQLSIDLPSICVYKDSKLTEKESILRATIEEAIAKNTNYKPELNNRDDKGEVKSLAYIATKNLLYFCSHDANAIRLIEDAEKLDTCLDMVSAIQPYEIMYYFFKNDIGDLKAIKSLYKYIYLLTTREKSYNPIWNEFIEKMDIIYSK